MGLKGGFLNEPYFPAFEGWSFAVEDETVSLFPN
jgi:hypothetical protein